MTEETREKLQRGLALFDFDGTLIPWDTQLLFADFVLRRAPWRRIYLPVFASFLPVGVVLGDEGLKRVFLSYLWGVDRDELDGWVKAFVEERVARACYPEMLERLARHREAGHLTVLASASPWFYIEEVGRVLGFDLAVGTPVEFGRRVPLFPELRNHKGAEKVRRLSEVLGAPDGKWANSHGYTDSTADLPMMACCENGTVVNPSLRLLQAAEPEGWEVVRPTLPWRGRRDKAWRVLRYAAGL